jgi:hypothetical protein
MITAQDVAWAAGIYEGEGCCRTTKDQVSGRPCSLGVVVSQKDPWLVNKLQEKFGGRIAQYNNNKGACYWHWYLGVKEGRGFLMTIYKFLSPRRKKQILIGMWGGELWDDGHR